MFFIQVRVNDKFLYWVTEHPFNVFNLRNTALLASAYDKDDLQIAISKLRKLLLHHKTEFFSVECKLENFITPKQRKMLNCA